MFHSFHGVPCSVPGWQQQPTTCQLTASCIAAAVPLAACHAACLARAAVSATCAAIPTDCRPLTTLRKLTGSQLRTSCQPQPQCLLCWSLECWQGAGSWLLNVRSVQGFLCAGPSRPVRDWVCCSSFHISGWCWQQCSVPAMQRASRHVSARTGSTAAPPRLLHSLQASPLQAFALHCESLANVLCGSLHRTRPSHVVVACILLLLLLQCLVTEWLCC